MNQRLALLVILATVTLAQENAPKFEVASIKPSDPNSTNGGMRTAPNGGVTLSNMTLKNMLLIAYSVRDFQISGGPAWMESERFDVQAKPAGPATPQDMPLMLRALLVDRFHLVVRKETKESTIYALVLARKDGKLGPKMIVATCKPYDPAHPEPDSEPEKTEVKPCGMSARAGNLQALGVSMEFLAAYVSSTVDRQAIDRTGLTGTYDVSLEWTPENRRADDNAGPSILTALQEHLGLKLESAQGPVDMLIVEHAEKPSEN